MMRSYYKLLFIFLFLFSQVTAQEKVFPGADETSLSRSQYFSWINNTNEGATEQQTLVNLDFFEWLRQEYGMVLDIYAFDAGLIDGKNFYGSMDSDRFKTKFPNGLDAVYNKAKRMDTRLGLWGGPDGFGDSDADARKRIREMVSLCRDYDWALFKFDNVCGPLRMEKEDYFIEMMKACREWSPDLILLNHRLGLQKAAPYATTFLWEGKETYIDVHSSNTITAPHNRADVLSRGLVPDLKRLTEDHGVCISSCLDFWDDDLVLQAFNRSLILSPQIYGNPWLLEDDEFPKLARIFNLHRHWKPILTHGTVLPESYGPHAVARGDESTRIVTLRNLEWEEAEYEISLDEEIGLTDKKRVQVRQFHPTEKLVGTYKFGEKVKVKVPPFRAVLLLVTTKPAGDVAYLDGIDYRVLRDVPHQPKEIELLGLPGTRSTFKLSEGIKPKKVMIGGKEVKTLARGGAYTVEFEGVLLKDRIERKVCSLSKMDTIPHDANTLYEATVFAADNNALEVRSLERSGETKNPQVQKARDAFFDQPAFIKRGLWDKYLFDGDMDTGFWPSRRFGFDQRIEKGCFRLDLGAEVFVDSIVVRVKDEYALQPLLIEEGNFAFISINLDSWETITYLSGLNMSIPIHNTVRYMKLREYPDAIQEIEVYSNGSKLDLPSIRASNLFADAWRITCEASWKNEFVLDEIPENTYLSVAINGKHGNEGAYAALKIDGEYVGSPSRAVSYPSNTWEYVTRTSDSNYTYYFPLSSDMIGKKIEVFVLAYDKEHLDLDPEVYVSCYKTPYVKKNMVIVN